MEDERKQIPADGLLKAKAQVETMRAAQMERAVAAGKPEGEEVARLIPSDWRWLGPGNVGGRIRSIIVHPTDANKIWVGSASGGIWRSANGGDSWAPVDDFMANLVVSTMAINPTNPNTLYAGTGEGFGNSDALRGAGVFRSTDGGVTWGLLPSTNAAIDPPPAGCGVIGSSTCPEFWFYVNRLAISPDGTTMLAASNSGFARSTDGGATWTQMGVAPTMDIDFRPGDSTQAVIGQLGRSFYTRDGGVTWRAAGFSPGITNGGTVGTNGRVEVAYAANNNPQIIYAGVNNNDGDLYQSTDGGQTYTRVNTGTNFYNAGAGNQGWYDNIVWVNPQDAAMVIVGGIDLWRSSDSGATFTQISRWQCGPGQGGSCEGKSVHADHHVIVAASDFNNTTNKKVYFGNDGGIFRTDDVLAVAQQTGWVNLNRNLGITQFYGGVAGPTGTLIGGTQDNGTVRNVPQPSPSPASYNSQAWTTPTGAGGDGGFVAADPTDANFLYTEYIFLQIRRSSDGGATTTAIFNGIADATCTPPMGGTCTPPANFVAPFVLDQSEPNRMLAGGVSLWRSNDVKTATTPAWTAIKAPADSGLVPASNVPISAIAIAENNSDFVVVGHNDGQIYSTSDATGAAPTWARIDTAGVPNRYVSRLMIDATRAPVWIYATFGGFSPDNVYVTRDLGATWVDITGTGTTGLPDVPVRSLVINPVRPDLLYVGTEIGIFASEDAGANWQLPHGGPSNVSVDELFWAQGFLTAATHGRGFYTTNNPTFIFGGAGGGSDCVFTGPCSPNNNCTPGDWDCPCTWGGGKVPGAEDDVAVRCANIRGGSKYVRNLRVNHRLSMADGNTFITVAETLSNYATISGGNIFTKHLLNSGTISTGKLRAREGNLSNGGTILSSAGYGFFSGDEYPVQANNISLGGHSSLSGVGILCKGNLVVGPGASIHALSGGPTVSQLPSLFVHGDVHNLGLIDVRGELAFSIFNDFAITRYLAGSGEWRLGALSLGTRNDPWFGNPAMFTLESDVTLNVVGLTAYGNWDPTMTLLIAANATIKQNNHTLTINAPYLRSYGQFDLGSGTLNLNIPYLRTQSITSPGRSNIIGPPGFKGSGSVNLTAPGGTYLQLDTRIFEPAFRLAAGTVDGIMGTDFLGPFTIDAGATLNVNGGVLTLRGDLLVNGAIGKTSAANLRSSFSYHGTSITNNGSIGGDIFEFNYRFDAVPRNMTITGAGAWPAATLVRVGFPNAATTINLANDLTFNWGTLAIWSNSRIDTGAFTLTMPCSTAFDTSSTSFSGEIIGTVRKTNIGDCTGAVPFNSRYTTVRFDSGTPPSEMIFSLGLTPPAGLTNAVLRSYQITPIGGSAYSSTLRLDYSPAETNGNPTGTLALWRNNGTDWIAQGATARDLTAHWVELSGVTEFSPWGLASCALSTLPTSASIASGGGMDSFQVLSTGGCGWTATSDAAWITVTSGASGTGNGAVGFSVAANTGTQRGGNITIAGTGTTQTFFVSQAADCSGLSINPTSATVASSGGSGSVAVTAADGCGWAATSNSDWISVESGASGSGNGAVGYYTASNYGPERSGTISISGQTFTITQGDGCYYYLGNYEQGVAAAGGSFSTDIYSEGGCPWTAVSNAAWITITPPASGTGNSTLHYAVAPNSGSPRVGTFSLGDQTFTIRQGSSAPLSLVVTRTNDDGAGSLRQALLDANANVGQTNTISFQLTGAVTIAPTQSLPEIANAVVINGINSDGRRVVLDGVGGGAYYGLVIAGADSTVRGLTLVRFYGSGMNLSAARTVIENCYFGTDTAGAPGLGNGYALEIYSSNNRIGGTAPGMGNVIASNTQQGIVVYSAGNVFQGNYIGTNAAGANLGNQADGIFLYGSDNVIGGTASQTGNTIAFNGGQAGVYVADGDRNAIRGNSIFANTGRGIVLGNSSGRPAKGKGPTASANNGQTFPILATVRGANKIDGTLEASPSVIFTVELFADDGCDPAGYGEGRIFLGAVEVATDASGHGSFTFALPSTVATGSFITATATDAVGNTSEFSLCLEVTPLRISSAKRLGSGLMQLQGIGVPNEQHTIEILSSLSGAVSPITISLTADAEGNWQYEDGEPGLRMRFYRLRFP